MPQRQLPLPFPAPSTVLPLIEGPSNAGAIDQLQHWVGQVADGVRPEPPVMALTGPGGSGKSRLLASVAEAVGGRVLHPQSDPLLKIDPAAPFMGVDDAHWADGMRLFSLYNECLASGIGLLLTGRGRPSGWGQPREGAPIVDLQNRLGALPVAPLDAPSEEMMADALTGALGEAGIPLRPEDARAVAGRLCRRFSAVAAIASDTILRHASGGGAVKALLQAAMRDNPDHVL